MRLPPCSRFTALPILFACLTASSSSSAQESGDLAKAAQNPVAAMISLPFQNNTLFGVGPNDDGVANVLNVQPVIPVTVGGWNLINRTIAPITHLSDLSSGLPELPADPQGNGSSFGLGDINHSVYVSPAASGPVIWGVGPSVTFPTATERSLGSGKWSAGPAAVALVTPGNWVAGSLVRQLWSFAGDGDRKDVNQLLIQPFINYNMDDGWYLVSSPVITADWNSRDGNRWTVPLGGGAGRIFKVGAQPVNAQMQAFYNVARPDFGADWSIRFQLQFLFPK
ncbi:hypothetical protein JJL56_31010 [Azospirillum sp. YIM DDC1]|uniref:Neuromedin U n=1 Tax=Azospirillum aestuarii TaxID=2802052 RepID=A0ABS1I878_9PROT|nr:hypothetical protein [Azospirillum aestuarii]MBK4723286.1 hypothetical protein [Azospirillum aestuarii]